MERTLIFIQAEWISTTQDNFRAPKTLLDPTYRPTAKDLQTIKQTTKSSGYATNHALQDGKGWKAHFVLKGDNNRSEYRDRFNAEHPFHRIVNVSKIPQLAKKEQNYKYN
jgi:hypothetical protein